MTDDAHAGDSGSERLTIAEHVSTEEYAASESRLEYVHALASNYCELGVDWPRAREGFAADLSSRAIGDLSVSTLRADPHKVSRTPTMVAADPTDDYMLALITRGATTVYHNEHRSQLGPGSFVLFDTTTPWVVDAPTEFEQIVVRTPRALLDSHMPIAVVNDFVGQSISSQTVIGRLVTRLLSDIAYIDESLSESAAAAISSAVMDLLVTAVSESTPPLRGIARVHAEDLQAVQRIMLLHLHDPDHSIAQTAAEAQMSVRHVHKLFSAAGMTPLRWLYQQRLGRARKLLLRTSLTVTEISQQVGFRDVAHFSRTFRNQFGASPAQYRAAARGQPAQGGSECD
ncbi:MULTISPECIES: helix-turn-helix domain-containing protein [Bacillati]|uniref:helix-turn-helix domain-containing protein n=1 Tax=Bacillus cereus TaxID=1396 RepID=UPI00362924CA